MAYKGKPESQWPNYSAVALDRAIVAVNIKGLSIRKLAVPLLNTV